MIACVCTIALANSAQTFGVFVNSFYPCVQDPLTSFPCYGGIDVGIIVIAFILFMFCVILTLTRIVKNIKTGMTHTP